MFKANGRRAMGVVSSGVALTVAAALGTGATASATPKASPSVAKAALTSVLGSQHAASGKAVTFGMINIETSPGGDFPEAREASQAAIKYLNAYRGGLDGHPIKLDVCVTDGTATTSQNCANQLVADHVTAIMGSTDLASAATLPIFAKAGLDEFGGVDLTPPMVQAPNSLVFNDVALAGNAAESTYIVKHLHAKKVGLIVIGDAQGESQASHFIVPVLKHLGAKYTENVVPPSVADASSAVASAVSGSPDAYFVESPSQCVSILTALKTLGNTKPVLAIDPCSSPGVIKASNGATAGVQFTSPYSPPSATTPDSSLYNAIVGKFAPATMPRDSISQEGVQTVMNLWSAFHTTPVAKLTSKYMLAKLKTGANHPNFLSSPYTCNGKAAPPFPALCDTVQYIHEITAQGMITQPSNQAWYGLQYLAG